MTDFLDVNPKFRPIVSINADLSNWDARELEAWELASKDWQKFAKKWCNADLNHIFGAQFRVLDLTPFPDTRNHCCIFIRDCYVRAEEMLWEWVTIRRLGGVIFTGQSGIGKSFFILYLLVRLLSFKQVVLLHLYADTSLLFYDTVVYEISSSSARSRLPTPSTGSTAFMWSLIDPGNKKPPPVATLSDWCFPVHAPSPCEDLYKQWRKERNPTVTGFPLWRRDELAISWQHSEEFQAFRKYMDEVIQHWHDLSSFHQSRFYETASLLRETGENAPASTEQALDMLLDIIIWHFGPIPRNVSQSVSNFFAKASYHKRAHRISLQKLREVVRGVASGRLSVSESPAICIDPIGDIRNLEDWDVNFKSTSIASQASERILSESDHDVRSFIEQYSIAPEGRGIAGSFFQSLVHRDITKGTTGAGADSWSLREMHLERREGSESASFVVDPSGKPIHGFSKISRTRILFDQAPAQLANDEYYIPRARNYPLFDSFIVHLDFATGSARLWLLQMTLSRKHGGPEKGYPEIRKIVEAILQLLKEHGSLRNSDGPCPAKKLKGENGEPKVTQWKPSVEVHYVLVRPAGRVEQNLRWELPAGWDDSNIVGVSHQGKGYLLEFPLGADDRS